MRASQASQHGESSSNTKSQTPKNVPLDYSYKSIADRLYKRNFGDNRTERGDSTQNFRGSHAGNEYNGNYINQRVRSTNEDKKDFRSYSTNIGDKHRPADGPYRRVKFDESGAAIWDSTTAGKNCSANCDSS